MRILLHCDYDKDSIAENFGLSEYSYWFVHESFRRVLEEVATTEAIRDPAQADVIWRQSMAAGEPCLLLSFNPPHKTPLGLACPTIPVFAWEYPDLPRASDESSWNMDPRHDWETVFRQVPAAITLSTHTADAVKRRLGPDYPIAVIPTPLWDRLAAVREKVQTRDSRAGRELRLNAEVVDSRALGLDVNGHFDPAHQDGTCFDPEDDRILAPNPPWDGDRWAPPATEARDLPSNPPSPARLADESEPISAGWFIPPAMNIRTRLGAVVYTSVLTPADGRKNWADILTAFIWALRDADEAVLIFKMGGGEQIWHHQRMVELLSRLSPFKCRVLVIHGYLGPGEYENLITNTDYYVNASLCEGLCMPLMEYLSCGIPAIAPDHTAMADYIDPDNAFVVGSGDGAPMVWPYGDLQQTRTTRPRIDWQSLMQAFRDSYRLATVDPAGYAAMSARAAESMRGYCGNAASKRRLADFLEAFGAPLALSHDSQPIDADAHSRP
ncbi:MAG: glycosyltransferase [Pseudoxanthomonas sp.]